MYKADIQVSEIGVKALRARFERPTKALTPEQFLENQRSAAEKEAQAILLARKKAATYNMAVREMEIKKERKNSKINNEEEKKEII